MNEQKELMTKELMIRRKAIINKIFLGLFLFIAVSALIMKITDGILLDLGWNYNGQSGIHLAFWMNSDNLNANPGGPLFNDPSNPNYSANFSMVSHHPSTVWLLTQFTWITTLVIIIFLVFRFFKYDETAPRWLRWIMTQRTLSLITMYDMIVSIVFWIWMFDSFDKAFNGSLRVLELIITAMVHAIIPMFMLVYSLAYLIKDRKASILREVFIIKGMIYPTLYIAYYILVSIVWSDPYSITHIHRDITDGNKWVSQLWIAIAVLLGIWTLLGLMIIFHNLVLLRFNKKYEPGKDYEILKRRKFKVENIRRSVIRKHARKMGYKSK